MIFLILDLWDGDAEKQIWLHQILEDGPRIRVRGPMYPAELVASEIINKWKHATYDMGQVLL